MIDDIIMIEMVYFDVILSMGWLSLCHAILDCYEKTLTLSMPGTPLMLWQGAYSHTLMGIISFMCATCLFSSGCLAYLSYVRDVSTEGSSLYLVLVFREYAYVFPARPTWPTLESDIEIFIYL